jgi:excisionase family DNA binding protein
MKAKTPQPTLQPRLLNIAEAAHYMGCSVWYVRNLVWDRKLPRLLLGRKLLFDRGVVDRFVDERVKEAA